MVEKKNINYSPPLEFEEGETGGVAFDSNFEI